MWCFRPKSFLKLGSISSIFTSAEVSKNKTVLLDQTSAGGWPTYASHISTVRTIISAPLLQNAVSHTTAERMQLLLCRSPIARVQSCLRWCDSRHFAAVARLWLYALYITWCRRSRDSIRYSDWLWAERPRGRSLNPGRVNNFNVTILSNQTPTSSPNGSEYYFPGPKVTGALRSPQLRNLS
jgi:hypothetical protein